LQINPNNFENGLSFSFRVSSVVEQWTVNPLVVCSNQTPGVSLIKNKWWRMSTSSLGSSGSTFSQEEAMSLKRQFRKMLCYQREYCQISDAWENTSDVIDERTKKLKELAVKLGGISEVHALIERLNKEITEFVKANPALSEVDEEARAW
jgi:hypothetical protein